MRTSYFSFGWGHVHKIDDFTYDRDIIVKITSDNPREIMMRTFGPKWCWEYSEEPDMIYFPRGIRELPGYEVTNLSQGQTTRPQVRPH